MKKDYDYDELFPGRFLKSGEFGGRDVTLKISDVELEELPDEKRGNRVRGIISFNGTKKQLVLNRTNGECLKVLFGRKVADWIGKRVTFFPAVVDAFGEETTAIRVRGSPDIAKDVSFELRLPQKKPKQVTLKRTGTATPAAAKPGANGNSKPAAQPQTENEAPLEDEEGFVIRPGGAAPEDDLGPTGTGERL